MDSTIPICHMGSFCSTHLWANWNSWVTSFQNVKMRTVQNMDFFFTEDLRYGRYTPADTFFRRWHQSFNPIEVLKSKHAACSPEVPQPAAKRLRHAPSVQAVLFDFDGTLTTREAPVFDQCDHTEGMGEWHFALKAKDKLATMLAKMDIALQRS